MQDLSTLVEPTAADVQAPSCVERIQGGAKNGDFDHLSQVELEHPKTDRDDVEHQEHATRFCLRIVNRNHANHAASKDLLLRQAGVFELQVQIAADQKIEDAIDEQDGHGHEADGMPFDEAEIGRQARQANRHHICGGRHQKTLHANGLLCVVAGQGPRKDAFEKGMVHVAVSTPGVFHFGQVTCQVCISHGKGRV